jgi:putative membrane protein
MLKRDDGLQSRVVSAVQSVEKVSAAEIVVTLTPRTVPPTVPVLISAVACGVFLLALHPLLFADASSLAIAVDTLVVSALAALMVRSLPPLQWLFLRRNSLEDAVLAAARAEFVCQGIHTTRKRTGMLLFLAVFERRSLLLVDIGVTAQLPAAVLAELELSAAAIGTAADSNAALDTFFDLLRRQAARYLPVDAADVNELADGLRSR